MKGFIGEITERDVSDKPVSSIVGGKVPMAMKPSGFPSALGRKGLSLAAPKMKLGGVKMKAVSSLAQPAFSPAPPVFVAPNMATMTEPKPKNKPKARADKEAKDPENEFRGENERMVKGMSPEERDEALSEITSMLSAETLGILMGRSKGAEAKIEDVQSESSQEEEKQEDSPKFKSYPAQAEEKKKEREKKKGEGKDTPSHIASNLDELLQAQKQAGTSARERFAWALLEETGEAGAAGMGGDTHEEVFSTGSTAQSQSQSSITQTQVHKWLYLYVVHACAAMEWSVAKPRPCSIVIRIHT